MASRLNGVSRFNGLARLNGISRLNGYAFLAYVFGFCFGW